MTGKIVPCLVALAAPAGCEQALTNRGAVHLPLAALSDGGRIYSRTTQTMGLGARQKGSVTGPLVVWERPGQQRKVLVTLVPAPGSAGQCARLCDPRATPTIHVSADGNRVWLVRDGNVQASFDYDAGVAILADRGHPVWAKPDNY